jgi:DNA-directed RNA polymerase
MNVTAQLVHEYNLIRQEALENESIELGIARYKKDRLEWHLADQHKGVDKVKPAGLPERVLLSHYIQSVSAAYAQWRDDVTADKARKHALMVHIFGEIDTDSMALIVLSNVIDSLGHDHTVQRVAVNTIAALVAEINYRKFKEGAPGYEYVMIDVFKKDSSMRHRKDMLRNCMERAKVVPFNLDIRERGLLFNLLLDLLIGATDLCTVQARFTGKHHSNNILVANPTILEWLEAMHSECAELQPDRLPMVCKPKPWTSPFDGGYITRKLQHDIIQSKDKGYLEELDNMDLSRVYSAINTIQETPWRINRKVLEVMQHCWDNDIALGGLPRRDREDLPTKPWDIDTNPESKREYARAARIIHDTNAKLLGGRINISKKLWTATKFQDEAAIYFPHHLDWRSRIYPLCGTGTVNPQSDDTGKALLEFSNGMALGESGGFWLCVHVANLFGIDKVEMEDRVLWVMSHKDELLACAENPVLNQKWTEADKPWCALAAIFEFAEFMEHGDDYESHLPIAMDGSNNGVQHLSAMGLDEHAAVNLTANQLPQDVYLDVAQLVSSKINSLALEGDEDALFWESKVVRKTVKQPVMTYAYGSTINGMREQLNNAAHDLGVWDGVDMDDKVKSAKCTWLATMIYPTIEEKLTAAAQIMAWLRHTARVVSSEGLPVTWRTPAGFLVIQKYTDMKEDRVRSFINGVQVALTYKSKTRTLDKRKQAAGISPNFVHSLDASHLMMTVNSLAVNDIKDIAVIHDSYGCHAAKVDVMQYLIRQEFTNMYSVDVLDDFRNQLIAQVTPETAKKIKPIPAKGDLDIREVMDSEYFFA